MGLIAGVSFNLIVGCLFGSFSVLLQSVEERMHVTPAMASAAAPLVIIGSALMASVAGELMARYSLRRLMLLGAGLSLSGYLLLAFTNNYAIYIASYALLLGPSMSLAGSVGPATLVTRWFSSNRGLALGLVNLSIGNAAIPVISRFVVDRYGAQATYLLMAALIGLCLVPLLLMLRDYPPGEAQRAASVAHGGGGESADALTVGKLLRHPHFWGLALAAAATITGAMVLTFNMMPIAAWLGIDRAKGALLLSIMATCGIAGSPLFGWVADRIGGARGLALLAIDSAVLFGLLLLDLPFPALAVVIGLLGLHGSGAVPNVSRALADRFGAESFSRAFGLSTSLSVPFTAIAVVGMTAAYGQTQTFAPSLAVLTAFFLGVAPLALTARVGRRPRPEATPA